jgi:hypothetical protein
MTAINSHPNAAMRLTALFFSFFLPQFPQHASFLFVPSWQVATDVHFNADSVHPIAVPPIPPQPNASLQ